jgi:hypothetical protein
MQGILLTMGGVALVGVSLWLKSQVHELAHSVAHA